MDKIPKTAFILAAGFGTRLKPFTLYTPKPLLTVFNKPVIAWHIDELIKAGIKHIIINTYHLKYKLESFVKYYFYEKTGRKDIRLTIIEENDISGTGGPLIKASGYIEEDNFFLINSDIIHKINLSLLAEFHLKKQQISTLAIKKTDVPALKQIAVNNNQEVVKAGEVSFKDEAIERRFLFTGIHVINKKIFRYCKENKFQCIIRDVYKSAVLNKETITAFLTEDYWTDMGNYESYGQLHRDILNKKFIL